MSDRGIDSNRKSVDTRPSNLLSSVQKWARKAIFMIAVALPFSDASAQSADAGGPMDGGSSDAGQPEVGRRLINRFIPDAGMPDAEAPDGGPVVPPTPTPAEPVPVPVPTQVMDFIQPDAGLRTGMDEYSDILSGHPHLNPPIYQCDDVRKKDKDRKGNDIDSPSPVFDTAKALQHSAKSKKEQIEERLKHLVYIAKDVENFILRSNAYPKGHPEWVRLRNQAEKLAEIYKKEKELNDKMKTLWEPIFQRTAAVRAAVKGAVMAEFKAGRSQKRCAPEQADIGPGSININYNWAFPFAEGDRSVATVPTSYNGLVAYEFTLAKYPCAKITNADLERPTASNSDIFEMARFFERVTFEHLDASIRRKEIFMEMEVLGNALDKRNPLRRRLLSIARKGQAHNEKIRPDWETIHKEVAAIKQAILTAERTETENAAILGRCEPRTP